MFGKRRVSEVERRKVEQQAKFRCAYCRGRVHVTGARAVKVRGQVQYVHSWHPVRAGE